MKNKIVSLLAGLLAAGSIQAADTAPTNQISDAVTKLKASANYSWTTTLEMADSQFTIGPIKGQADKDGFADIKQSFNDNTTEVVLKGDKAATKVEEAWQLLGDGGGFETFFAANIARNGAPTAEAPLIAKYAKDLKAGDGDVLASDLTTEGATDLMSFGPRRAAGAEGGFPGPKNAKGSAKFWVKDGVLVKYQVHLHGTVSFGDNENEMDMTRTTEIQSVGTTKMEIPAEAKKALEAKPAAK